jgi:hypothetical protein
LADFAVYQETHFRENRPPLITSILTDVWVVNDDDDDDSLTALQQQK